MASSRPSPAAARPPPDIPYDPATSQALSRYLRTFALWCREGFVDSMRSHEAQAGILLRAYDTPAGATPAVFMLEVNSAGILRTRAMPLGSGGP